MSRHQILVERKYYLACQDGRWDDREFDTMSEAQEALNATGDFFRRGLCIMFTEKEII